MKVEEIEKAERTIRFWIEEYDGAYPPRFHHPVTDMKTVEKGWQFLLSRIHTLEEGIRDFLDGCKGEDHGIPDWLMTKLRKLLEEKGEEH